MAAIAVLATGGLVIIGFMVRSGKPVHSLLSSAVQGVLALAVVNLTGTLTGVTLSVNAASLGVAALGGVPGIIGLLMMNIVMAG